jgi:hypothetical protein
MTTGPAASARWEDAGWLASAVAWVRDALAATGRELTGEPDQHHRRAWATVLRCPTADGDVWFKAMARGTAHELPLLTALAGWFPDRVLVPLAVDAERAWLLLPDGGTTLRNAQHGHTDEAHWAEILRDHAEFQRLTAPHADDLVALGVPDLRPLRLPVVRDALLADEAWLRVGRDDGLSTEQLAALRADADRYARWCQALADTGVPASINHDDLHDNNVFAPAEPGGHYRIFDWGDTSIAHPFGVLLVALRVVGHLHDLPEGAPELLRLRDAYLEPWTAEHDRATLVEAVRLALRVGGVSRARCYWAALQEGTHAEIEEVGGGVPLWLLETYVSTPVEAVGPGLPGLVAGG